MHAALVWYVSTTDITPSFLFDCPPRPDQPPVGVFFLYKLLCAIPCSMECCVLAPCLPSDVPHTSPWITHFMTLLLGILIPIAPLCWSAESGVRMCEGKDIIALDLRRIYVNNWIPDTIGSLTALHVLNLYNCRISGCVSPPLLPQTTITPPRRSIHPIRPPHTPSHPPSPTIATSPSPSSLSRR